MENYTETEAERLIGIEKFQINPLSSTCSSNTSCNSKTDWLSMTTTATKLTNGRIMLHNNFTWLKIPTITMTDMVGMNYNDSVILEPNTTKFSYKYTDGTGTHSVGAKNLLNNANGIAATFNLKTYGSNSGPYNHNGYISVEVSKGNKYDKAANVFGQYTHTTASFNVSLSIKSGDISLGLTTAESKMPTNTLKISF